MNKKTLYLLYMSVVALLLTGCTGGGTSGKRVPQAGDTLYTEDRAMAIFDSLPERALQIIDSAEVVGNLTDYRANLVRAKVLSQSTAMQQQDSAVIICEALLRHDHCQRNVAFRQDVLELLVNTSRTRHDYEEMVHWTTELAQLLRGQGLATEALRTDADLGLAMTHIGQVDEGLAKIDHAIRQLGNDKKFNGLDAWLIATRRKINVLQEQEIRSDEVITLANQIQQRLDNFAARPDDYHDGTYREPPKEDIPTYHDFYYAQACAYKAAAYTAQGNRAAAQREIAAFRLYPYCHSLDGRMMIARTLGRLGDYETMLATYDDFERYMLSEGDTLNGARIEVLRGRAEAANAFGHTTQAYDYMRRYDELKSQLSDNLQRSKAHLYAARYHTLELETALHQERVIHMKNLFVNVLIGMVLFIVVAAAVYLYRQRRLLRKKNYILVQKIEDAQEYKRLYQSLKAQKSGGLAKPDDDTTVPTRLEAMTDAELFDYISDVVRHEQLFLRPVCDRQTLVERFHLSEKRIGAAFSKGSSYGNVSNFVRNARLEYACQLLRKSPTMPIADVAAASGFPSYPRFAMDFKAAYSISPTEYRRQSRT